MHSSFQSSIRNQSQAVPMRKPLSCYDNNVIENWVHNTSLDGSTGGNRNCTCGEIVLSAFSMGKSAELCSSVCSWHLSWGNEIFGRDLMAAWCSPWQVLTHTCVHRINYRMYDKLFLRLDFCRCVVHEQQPSPGDGISMMGDHTY